ncbi:MAG TPA: DUF883 family protein [Candidatus Deferrimicrobium sp.]|nr:DUF883 family protein [Candidatus Deferrimicrobium sp.]
METSDVNRDKLVADMRVVIADAEELLRATAGQAGEKVTAARARIQDSIATAKAKLEQLSEASAEKAKAAAHATDAYVHDHPWHAVGFAALVGLLLGTLISRR